MTPEEAGSFIRRMVDRVDTARFVVSRIKGAHVEIIPSFNPDSDSMSFQIRVLAKSKSDALAATKHAFEAIVGRNEASIRVPPEADSQHDFEKMVTLHKGYARFTVWDNVGPRHAARAVLENCVERTYTGPPL